MAKKDKKIGIDVFTINDIPGIGPVSKEKLIENGITDYFAMTIRSYLEISEIIGVDKDKVAKAVAFCRKILIDQNELSKGDRTATEIWKERKTLLKIKTGSTVLDELLDGGIEIGSLSEIAGEFGSGKTQFCFWMAIKAQLPVEKGGLMKKDDKRIPCVLWIEAERTFRPERIMQMILGSGFAKNEQEGMKFLDNIIVQRVHNASHQISTIQNSAGIIKELNVKLMVVDSATSLARGDYVGMGYGSRRADVYKAVGNLLTRIGETHKIAIVVTNQVYESFDQFKPGLQQIGGHAWGHIPTYRYMIKKRQKGKFYVLTSVDSPMHAVEDAEFEITEKGLGDRKK